MILDEFYSEVKINEAEEYLIQAKAYRQAMYEAQQQVLFDKWKEITDKQEKELRDLDIKFQKEIRRIKESYKCPVKFFNTTHEFDAYNAEQARRRRGYFSSLSNPIRYTAADVCRAYDSINKPKLFEPKEGEVVLVRDSDDHEFEPRLFLAKLRIGYLCVAENDASSYLSGNTYDTCLWEQVKKYDL